MILVKVIDRIVDVNRCSHVALYLDIDYAVRLGLQIALRIVFMRKALNLLTHCIESQANEKEDDTKDAEDDHGGTERWNRAPSC